MVAASKFYEWPINVVHCSQIVLHPGISCWKALPYNAWCHFVYCCKYFSPLLFTPLLLNFNSLSFELAVNMCMNYLKTAISGAAGSTAIFFLVCIFRNILGCFNKYSLVYLPTYFGMQVCWFFPKRVLQLFVTATTQAVVEGLLRQHSNPISKILLNSIPIQTLLFMLSGATIMHLKSKKIYSGFWFINPPENAGAAQPVNKITCLHAENIKCWDFILQGIKTYLLFGIPVDVISAFLKEQRAFLSVHLLWNMRFNTTAFCLSYITIYRLISCIFGRWKCSAITSSDQAHFAAAFLSGIAYIFMPKIGLSIFAAVLSVQGLWQAFCNNEFKCCRSTIFERYSNFLCSIPMSKILIPINISYLVHSFIFQRHVLNSLSKGFVNAFSANKTQFLVDVVEYSDLEVIAQVIKTTPIKGFSC